MIGRSLCLVLCASLFSFSIALSEDRSPAQKGDESALGDSTANNKTTDGAAAHNAKVVFYLPDPNSSRSNWAATTTPTIPDDAAQHVSVVIQIDGEPDQQTWSRDTQAAAATLTSTVLIDAAAQSSLKLTPEQRRKLVVVAANPTGMRFTRLEVALRKNDAVKWQPNDAAKLLAALCDQLKSAYEESTRASVKFQQSRTDEVREKIAVAEQRLQEIKDKQRAARAAMAEVLLEGMELSSALRNARSQRANLVSEVARLRAKLSALEPVAGPLASEWEQVVKLRADRVAELNQAAKDGKEVTNELKDAEIKLAEAKAKQSDVKRGDTSETQRSNRVSEAPQLRSQVAEAEARLKTVADSLARLEDPNLTKLSEQMPELQNQEQRARQEVIELVMRLDNIRRMSQWEPRVVITVLDGKPDDVRSEK